MTPEAIALALANAVRPTGIAAVYALLSSAQPKRMLSAYILAGFAWSSAVGILVVGALHGVNVQTASSKVTAIVFLLGGVASLGFAAGRATGRLQPRRRAEPAEQPSRLSSALRNPSPRIAAGAGVATHLPGLFYLLGLNAIAAPQPGLADSVVAVLIFNAIWFSAAIASLVLSVRRPEVARHALRRVNEWARRHENAIVTTLFALAGAYFTVKGAFNLLL